MWVVMISMLIIVCVQLSLQSFSYLKVYRGNTMATSVALTMLYDSRGGGAIFVDVCI